MATGDTIGGSIRVIHEDTQGNRNIVLGDVPQDQVDYVNQSPQPDERFYVNTGRTARVNKPAGARSHDAPGMVFNSGEKLIVQHSASATVSGDIDLDADAFSISGISKDRNTGNAYTNTLTQADTELSGTTAESTEWVDMFEYTVPDRRTFLVAGEFGAAAIES
jgi:hypothetical protein